MRGVTWMAGGVEMDDKAEIPRGGGTNNVSRYA